jgi:hypothetical protein
LNVHDDYRPRPVVSKVSTSPPAVIETETKDAIEEEILESVPKTMKTKAELLVRKMKADPNIAWSEKGELKYKGETARGSNVVDLDLGGNVYLTVDNNDKTDYCVDIRYRWYSPVDHKMYPIPQGLSLTFEQFDKLKDVAKVLHYIAFCPLRYVPQILMSLLSECARDTPSRNRVRWDYIHHNI